MVLSMLPMQVLGGTGGDLLRSAAPESADWRDWVTYEGRIVLPPDLRETPGPHVPPEEARPSIPPGRLPMRDNDTSNNNGDGGNGQDINGDNGQDSNGNAGQDNNGNGDAGQDTPAPPSDERADVGQNAVRENIGTIYRAPAGQGDSLHEVQHGAGLPERGGYEVADSGNQQGPHEGLGFVGLMDRAFGALLSVARLLAAQ